MKKNLVKAIKIFKTKGFLGVFKASIKKCMRKLAMKNDVQGVFGKSNPIHIRRGVVILATPHCRYVALLLADAIRLYGIRVKIIYSTPSVGYRRKLHFVICPQMFSTLPSTYVAVQMEQSVSNRWFTSDYLKILERAHSVMEYSPKNLEYLIRNSMPYKHIFYTPLWVKNGDGCYDNSERGIDILFYGDLNNDRRRKALEILNANLPGRNIKVVSNVFGDELEKILRKTKIVVNIHYYADAILETTRICEALSKGCLVVSEESSDPSLDEMFKEMVFFCSQGDYLAMANQIEIILSGSAISENYRENTKKALNSKHNPYAFYISRWLLAFDFISYDEFYKRVGCHYEIPSTMICLSLPECVDRRKSFLNDNKFGFVLFDGLRHSIGWIGCGMSYKFLMQRARELEIDRLAIVEDDVDFPKNFSERYDEALCYLETENEWDIFSGLIADLHPDVCVRKVSKNRMYIHIDKMVSMVFNVYNRKAIRILSAWNPKNREKENTIDRYIERKSSIDVITTLPFLVGHKEDHISSLWNFSNIKYSSMIESSKKRLEDAVGKHLEMC